MRLRVAASGSLEVVAVGEGVRVSPEAGGTKDRAGAGASRAGVGGAGATSGAAATFFLAQPPPVITRTANKHSRVLDLVISGESPFRFRFSAPRAWDSIPSIRYF